MNKTLPMIALTAAALLATPAFATSGSTYTATNKSSHCGSGSTGGGSGGSSSTCPTFVFAPDGKGTQVVSSSAFYDNGTSGNLASASLEFYGTAVGVTSGSETRNDSPNHALDNDLTLGAGYEWVMLSFDEAVSLHEITLSWMSGDADMTILASNQFSNDLSAWTWIENVYYGVNPDLSTSTAFSTDSTTGLKTATLDNETCASYWLIGALNPSFHTNPSGYQFIGNDYFKVYSVAACTDCGQPSNGGTVPEPGSLALAGLGLLGVMGMRRYRK